MISSRFNFLFIHVPKTRGNSIQNILMEFLDDRMIVKEDNSEYFERFNIVNKEYKIRKRSTLTYYMDVLGKSLFSQLFEFTAIRKPWDRMVSHFFSPHIDRLLRYESLDDDFAEVCDLLNIPRRPLSHVNVSKKGLISKWLS